MMTKIVKSMKLFLFIQGVILLGYFISFEFFINLEIAFLSSFLIVMGSMYGYKKMVYNQVASQNYEDKRDILEIIEDPHELYDETPINEVPLEDLDFKAIVQEEKKKIKTLSLHALGDGVKGGFSLFRLIPYLFLFLGFIALKNNDLLDIAIYLPSLLVGIVSAYFVGKNIYVD
ncbi:MAG: hypothetical protein RBR59_03120 [Sulfurimonadaceae bacterium]|nr:hypothetical protein [Sulfurimonadaceae bacterium]